MELYAKQKSSIFIWITVILLNCIEGRPTLVEWDIHENQPLIQTMMTAVTINTNTWLNGKIPYILDQSITRNKSAVVSLVNAMQTIETLTNSCIDFFPRASSSYDYINITAVDSECYSSVGRKTGGQILNLGPGCFTEQIILHELLHALGFWHEHSRTDRDNYVDIKYNNIIDGEESNFKIRSDSTGVESAVKYDFFSLLHYKRNQFSKLPSYWDTIVPNAAHSYVDKNKLGQGKTLSELDIKRIKWLYHCSDGSSHIDIMPIQSTCPLPDFEYVDVSPRKSTYYNGEAVKFTCKSGRTLIGGDQSTCMSGGIWSGAKPYCIISSADFIYCDMKDACLNGDSSSPSSSWIQIYWQKHPETTYPKISPATDHTTQTKSGRYLYIGPEVGELNRAYLLTPPLQYNASGCLMFYYNMYGKYKNSTLRVLIQGREVWSNSASTVQNKWARATIQFTPAYRYSYRALFIAEKGRPHLEATVAIDDVFMGPCHDVKNYARAIDQIDSKPREYD